MQKKTKNVIKKEKITHFFVICLNNSHIFLYIIGKKGVEDMSREIIESFIPRMHIKY